MAHPPIDPARPDGADARHGHGRVESLPLASLSGPESPDPATQCPRKHRLIVPAAGVPRHAFSILASPLNADKPSEDIPTRPGRPARQARRGGRLEWGTPCGRPYTECAALVLGGPRYRSTQPVPRAHLKKNE